MSILVLVPARGGSKGLPGKNLLPVGGLSLTARAVLAGRRFLAGVPAGGAVVVDTDDAAIAEEGRRYGADVPFLRPAALAADATPTLENVLHCVQRLADAGRAFDTVVLLQPTSPLRTADDIAEVWRAFDASSAPSALSVTPLEHPSEFNVRRADDGVLTWVGQDSESLRRQDAPRAFRPTGAVYVITVALLRERRAFLVPGVTRGVVLPASRSVDVDTRDDLLLADALARAAAPRAMSIADKVIGAGRCFVIAEAGVNHNGDPVLAAKLVEAAAKSGADAVKFQTFDPDRLAAADAGQPAYQKANTGIEESQRAMLRKLVLPQQAYPALKKQAESLGLVFLSTPFDEGSADFLEQLGVPAFKVASGDLTNLPFLAHLASKDKPLLLSTGMGNMAEVAEAVLAVALHGGPPLGLLHCVTNYPAAPEQCNLAAMASMRAAFGVPVGWSDHTLGLDVSLAAAAMGAEVIEKHLTLDRNMPGPDHKASLEPDEFTTLMRSIRGIEGARGNGLKQPVAVEAEFAATVRRSLHARRALAAGHVLSAEDLVVLRPGTGLPPAALLKVVGRPLRTALPAGARLLEEHIG